MCSTPPTEDGGSRGRNRRRSVRGVRNSRGLSTIDVTRQHFLVILEDDFSLRIDSPLDPALKQLSFRVHDLRQRPLADKDRHRALLSEMIPFYESLLESNVDPQGSYLPPDLIFAAVISGLQSYLEVCRRYRHFLHKKRCSVM